jgi:adenylate kinase
VLQANGKGNPLVLNVNVDQDLLLKRLTGRRTCAVCGEIYNVYFSPPRGAGICDKDGGRLLQRADDNEATIRERLVAYEKQTSPLIDYYRRRGVLYEVDGNRGPEPIAKELIDFLGKA